MSFEERLLMELKTEIASRQAKRRRFTGRRLFAGAAVAGLAAAAAIAVPLLTGSETPAYAVTKNGDGTIRVQINEFRDADQLETDLKKLGVTADVTYIKPGKRCEPSRGQVIGEKTSDKNAPREEVLKAMRESTSYKAVHMRDGGADIDPSYVKPGQTLVMEFTENEDQTSGPEKPRVLWQFGGYVVQGPVKPCKIIDDPSWNDLGGPEGQPPAGS
ncbi:hypothetical protein ABZ297_30290 [Nonomuraea sp. NPDC005983]|uniref:hypothetical protein n=1 Tax=Nonomuraea sp. NPDC005983 TaxID=3155595 RepID=UPI0033A3E76A